jgi:hypothetical protein
MPHVESLEQLARNFEFGKSLTYAVNVHRSFPGRIAVPRLLAASLAGTRDSSIMRTKSLSAMRIERPNL